MEPGITSDLSHQTGEMPSTGCSSSQNAERSGSENPERVYNDFSSGQQQNDSSFCGNQMDLASAAECEPERILSSDIDEDVNFISCDKRSDPPLFTNNKLSLMNECNTSNNSIKTGGGVMLPKAANGGGDGSSAASAKCQQVNEIVNLADDDDDDEPPVHVVTPSTITSATTLRASHTPVDQTGRTNVVVVLKADLWLFKY